MEEDVDRLTLPGEYLTPGLDRRQGREGGLETDAGVGLIRHRGDQIEPPEPPAAEGLEPEGAGYDGLGPERGEVRLGTAAHLRPDHALHIALEVQRVDGEHTRGRAAQQHPSAIIPAV